MPYKRKIIGIGLPVLMAAALVAAPASPKGMSVVGIAAILLSWAAASLHLADEGMGALRWRMPDGKWNLLQPLLLGLGALALASSLWAIDPSETLTFGLRFLLLTVAVQSVCLAMPRPDAPVEGLGPVGASIFAVLIFAALGLEHFFGDRIYHGLFGGGEAYGNALSIFVLMFWPLLVRLIEDRRVGLMFLMTATLLFVATGSANHTAQIGFMVSIGVFIGFLLMPKAVTIAGAILTPLFVLVFPFVVRIAAEPVSEFLYRTNGTVALRHRLAIWEFVADRIVERPWLGWGFESARSIPGGDTLISFYNTAGELRGTGMVLPLHPHNASMQIWLELGVPGALIAAAFAGLLFFRTGSQEASRVHRAAGFAALSAAFIMAHASYGIWQSWWLSTLFLCAVSFLWLRRDGTTTA